MQRGAPSAGGWLVGVCDPRRRRPGACEVADVAAGPGQSARHVALGSGGVFLGATAGSAGMRTCRTLSRQTALPLASLPPLASRPPFGASIIRAPSDPPCTTASLSSTRTHLLRDFRTCVCTTIENSILARIRPCSVKKKEIFCSWVLAQVRNQFYCSNPFAGPPFVSAGGPAARESVSASRLEVDRPLARAWAHCVGRLLAQDCSAGRGRTRSVASLCCTTSAPPSGDSCPSKYVVGRRLPVVFQVFGRARGTTGSSRIASERFGPRQYHIELVASLARDFQH